MVCKIRENLREPPGPAYIATSENNFLYLSS